MNARAAEHEQHAALEGIANTSCDDGQHCVSIDPIQVYKSYALRSCKQTCHNQVVSLPQIAVPDAPFSEHFSCDDWLKQLR